MHSKLLLLLTCFEALCTYRSASCR